METILTLDKSSRILLTEDVRRALGVGPGDKLRLTMAAGRCSLEPLPINARNDFKRRKGRLIYSGLAPNGVDAVKLVREQRESRT